MPLLCMCNNNLHVVRVASNYIKSKKKTKKQFRSNSIHKGDRFTFPSSSPSLGTNYHTTHPCAPHNSLLPGRAQANPGHHACIICNTNTSPGPRCPSPNPGKKTLDACTDIPLQTISLGSHRSYQSLYQMLYLTFPQLAKPARITFLRHTSCHLALHLTPRNTDTPAPGANGYTMLHNIKATDQVNNHLRARSRLSRPSRASGGC